MHNTMPRTVTPAEGRRPLIAGRLGPLSGNARDPLYQAFLLLWAGFTVARLAAVHAPMPFRNSRNKT